MVQPALFFSAWQENAAPWTPAFAGVTEKMGIVTYVPTNL